MPYFGIPIRNGLPIGLGSVAGFGIAPFSPESLFENGEQGAWYDPSDYSTLFEDAAGTTPVTAVEQAVGLMLDKSKGLVLGSELSNPATQTLVTATGTQSGAGWNVTATGNFAQLLQSNVLTASIWYKVRFKWSGNTNGRTIRFLLGGTGATYTAGTGASGDVTFYITSSTSNTSAYFQINDSVNGDTFYLEITSVQALPGNHATQSTSANRPVLRALYNLLQYTEEFDNGYWTNNSRITANTAVAPDETTTADTLTSSGLVSQNFVGTSITSTSNVQYTLSVSVKYTNNQWICLQLSDSGTTHRARAWFDIQNGVRGTTAVTGSGVVISHTITPEVNGWYRCTLTATNPITTLYAYFPLLVTADGSLTLAANLQSCYLWGADLRPASQATGLIGPTYQRVVTNTLLSGVYDSAGFLPYLAFNGTNSSMSTGSINPGAVDKAQVFAGVRKLSDDMQRGVAEFNDGVANNGRWALLAPSSAASNYQFSSLGTIGSNAIATTYAAPITNVLSAYAEIGQDVCVLRVNGVQAATSTTNQGTGNYLTYPLYVGSRATGTPVLNGWLTSLIVRFGPNLSTSQIEATESWVNGKTGAY